MKFLLATTDPQKLPMTILSRCLQFNLKNMNPERIVQHLKFVLNEELVPFEESALWHLGRAADGSMRDAMSLTDQAIAYGSGKITEAEVSTMLGTIDQTAVYDIVTALVSLDGRAVLAAVERMSEQAPDYASALAEMLAVLHRIAIAQALPEAVDNSHGDRERIMQLAQQLPSEDVQLFYQTALLGRRDLPLAPDPRAGFEMVLLRMLAFKPQGVLEVPTQALPQSATPVKPATTAPVVERAVDSVVDQVVAQTAAPIQSQPVAPVSANPPVAAPVANNHPPVATVPVQPQPQPQPQPQLQQAPVTPEPPPYESYSGGLDDDYAPAEDEYEPAPAYYEAPVVEVNEPKKSEAAQPPAMDRAATPAAEILAASSATPVIEKTVVEPVAPPVTKALRKVPYEQAGPADWTEIYLGLGVTGILQSTVANCQMIGRQGNVFHFVLDKANSTLYDTSHEKRLEVLLRDYFVEQVTVHIQMGETTAETPAKMAIRLREERLQDAIISIKNDPIVQQLIAQ
ncbi:MAG TPA: DNA polymerase III subunit gamma/tau C-terminal domain-containing protein, partial [Candidatus Angelobacter sp.]|nr:DNA polymerase III subunit gamma/tau C-terminal domain-containing protein [Candidatus Angelobacter sp.]